YVRQSAGRDDALGIALGARVRRRIGVRLGVQRFRNLPVVVPGTERGGDEEEAPHIKRLAQRHQRTRQLQVADVEFVRVEVVHAAGRVDDLVRSQLAQGSAQLPNLGGG